MKKTLYATSILMTALFSACAEKKCENGKQDKKEAGVDCGGVCDVCPVTYPANGNYGPNVLDQSTTSFQSDVQYSLSADLPEGSSLKVVFTNTSANPGSDLWFYSLGTDQNLVITTYNETTYEQEFQSTASGHVDLNLTFDGMGTSGEGSANIKIYENNATSPTREKDIIFTY